MMILFSSIGFIISLFYFFLSSSPISYTGGAELVIWSTLAITILSVLLYLFQHAGTKWGRVIFYILIMGLILGTLLAAWLLENWALFVMMMLVLVAWFIQIFTPQLKNETSS